MSKEVWDSIPIDTKVQYVGDISKVIERHVDEQIYEQTQQLIYHSPITDFKVGFKQEIICSTALFIGKKQYAYYMVDEKGIRKDSVQVTGLSIIRSETPTIFRVALKDVLKQILTGASDKDLTVSIDQYKNSMIAATQEEVSSNIGINNMSKYIVDGYPVKGTPWHVKGAHNYHLLLKEFKLNKKYESIREGDKAKVVYVKKNRYGIETVAYYQWPKEFLDKGIVIDYNKQLEKFFLGKIRYLLEPQNRERILDQNVNTEVFF